MRNPAYTRRGTAQRIRTLKRFVKAHACDPASYLLEEIVESGHAHKATLRNLQKEISNCRRRKAK
jgi:hypothetical protein